VTTHMTVKHRAISAPAAITTKHSYLSVTAVMSASTPMPSVCGNDT
jgi:hypothetical protein